MTRGMLMTKNACIKDAKHICLQFRVKVEIVRTFLRYISSVFCSVGVNGSSGVQPWIR